MWLPRRQLLVPLAKQQAAQLVAVGAGGGPGPGNSSFATSLHVVRELRGSRGHSFPCGVFFRAPVPGGNGQTRRFPSNPTETALFPSGVKATPVTPPGVPDEAGQLLARLDVPQAHVV